MELVFQNIIFQDIIFHICEFLNDCYLKNNLRSRLLRRENNAIQNQLTSTAEFKDTVCQTTCIYIEILHTMQDCPL